MKGTRPSLAAAKFSIVSLFLLLFLVAPGAVRAQYGYSINPSNTNTITITNYTGPGGAVTIPSNINGLTVTVIGTNAFFQSTAITTVTIPDTVISIEDQAFEYCVSLGGVSLGNGVSSIGNYAFSSCALSNITITTNVVSIGDGAFEYNRITFLTPLTIPNNVTSIGDGAFGGIGVTTVTIPAGITNLGGNPFPGALYLQSIAVAPSNPFYVSDDGLLYNYNHTALIAYPAGLTGSSYFYTNTVTSIANDAFNSCSGLTNLTISPNVLNIGSNAFANCTNLTNVTISAAVTNISRNPFGTCNKLVAINVNSNNPAYSSVAGVLFNKSQTFLLDYPLANNATSYSIPATVTGIADEAFAYCSRLTNLSFPNGVLSIGNSAFLYCSNLSGLTLPNSLTNLGVNAFANCAKMRTLTLSSNLASIPASAFVNCTQLTNLTIPDSVTSIGASAFLDCDGLTNLIIPASISSIGSDVFLFTPLIRGVYCQGNAPSADSTVFYLDSGTTVYYLPGTTGWGTNFGGRPTVLWNPLIQSSGTNFGPLNNQFGFNVTGTTNIPMVIQASTNLASPVWTSLTNLNLTNGLFHFSDSQWTNFPSRYYRICAP